MNILVLNGPNLNLLGEREPNIYGKTNIDDLNKILRDYARDLGIKIHFSQSNSEGGLIDILHGAKDNMDAIIFNPGAFSHYSIAIRDAVTAIGLPVIEVHISNISARESFRTKSVIAPVCIGQISGLGLEGYGLALKYLAELKNDYKV